MTEFPLFFHRDFALKLWSAASKLRSNVNVALHKHGVLGPEFNNLASDLAA